MIRNIFVVLALLFCYQANAADNYQTNESIAAYNKAPIRGMGAMSCGKWLAAREAKNRDYYGMLDYMMGLIDQSIAQTAYDRPRDKQVQYDVDSLSYWIDNHCKKNPTDLVATAARYFWAVEHGRLNKD